MSRQLPVCEAEMMTIPHVTKANYVKYGAKLLEITTAFTAEKFCKFCSILNWNLKVVVISMLMLYYAAILAERQCDNIDDDFEDLSQIQPSNITGPPVQHASPYFGAGGGRKSSGGYKRKRGGFKAGGDKKLTKKGKWLGKKTSSQASKGKVPFSANRSSGAGSSYAGTSSGHGVASSSNRGGMGLLAPPRPRTVKRE